VKLLFDQNLSRHLVSYLARIYPDSVRVGNQTTEGISALLSDSVEIIKQFVASEESALLVLPNLNS